MNETTTHALSCALSMYDLPEARAATDAWWGGIARGLAAEGYSDVPARLDRERPREDIWRDPGLLLAQTCGYPLLNEFAPHLQLVATPVYDADGCTQELYRSAFLVRTDDPATSLPDLRGRTVGYNGEDSQSGYNCLRAAIAPLASDGKFFGQAVKSGAQRNSLAMLRAGQADLVAVDGVTLAMVRRHAPDEWAGLRILDWSEPAPSLPYVTSAKRSSEEVARIQSALARAFVDDAVEAARSELLIADTKACTLADYACIAEMEQRAISSGYGVLA